MNDKFHITVLSWPIFFAFIFTVLPLVFMILIAFTEFDRFHQPPGSLFTWIGFDNFVNMFSGENAFYSRLPGTLWAILQWSFVWAIFATFLNYFFGMILALMINKKGIKLKALWRTVFVLTIAVPQFISLLIMRNFFNEQGPFVKFLLDLGLVTPGYSPFAQVDSARFWVIIVNLWVGVPYSMLITSGILMNIPADLYESATIDGAGTITKFFKITLPYMLFVTGPYLLTAFIGNINNFNIIYFLTGGGPSSQTLFQAGQTDLLVTWLFKLTLFDSDYKMASTLGILIFMISSFLSLIIFAKTGGVKAEDSFQ
jgi:arabinogalactan oligomer/maltooligosaccharide transport system permease protein